MTDAWVDVLRVFGNEILFKKGGFTRNEWTVTREGREGFFMPQEVY